MAGVDVGVGAERRRVLSQEINMVPMIDLMMVTISFLLITAVWTHLSRLDANANVPHPCESGECGKPPAEQKTLHVDMRSSDHFTITWKRGDAVLDSFEVPRHGTTVASVSGEHAVKYPELAQKLGETWTAQGEHRAASDPTRDRAVLHSADGTSYAELVAVMDAVRAVDRQGDGKHAAPAFDLVFSMK